MSEIVCLLDDIIGFSFRSYFLCKSAPTKYREKAFLSQAIFLFSNITNSWA